MSTILQSSSIWNKLERWKHSVSGCLMSWPQIKKIIILKCLLLFYATTSHFSIGLWCVMKSGFYMTMGEDQLSGWTEKKLQSTSQSQTSPKKRSSSLLGGLLPVWSTTAFWIPVKPLISEKYVQQINEMHWKLQCLQPALVNRKGPILLHNNAWLPITQPMLHKLNELGYKVLPHLPYSPDFLPTNYHFFKNLDNFLQGKHFHNQQEAEHAFQEFIKSRNMDFHAIGKSKCISCWQKNVLI